MILYHFTSLVAWERIRRDGKLKFSNPQVHPHKPGPPVVWLTNRAEFDDPFAMGLGQPGTNQLRDFAEIDKCRIRITVDVHKSWTHKWVDWAPRHGGHPRWISAIRSQCRLASSWYVHTHTVERTLWCDVLDVHDGRHLSIAPTLAQLGFRRHY